MDIVYALMIARTVTYAQRMRRALDRAGIVSWISRAPRELAQSGCAYAVRVSDTVFREAWEILRGEGLTPARVFLYRQGKYEEVTP